MLPSLSAAVPLQAPAPAPEVHAAPRPPGAHPFAELLRRTQAAPVPAPVPEPASSGAEDRDDPTPDVAEASKPSPGQKAKPRTRSAATAPRTEKAERNPRPEPESSAKADDTPATAAATSDAALAQWLADLHLAPAGKADAANPTEGTEDAARAIADDRGDGRGRRHALSSRTAQDLDAGADRGDKTPGDELQSARTARSEPQVPAIEARDPRAHEPGPARVDLPASTALAAPTFASAGPPAGALGAIADVQVATPLAAPDFAEALGVQLSVLAKDGVHRAELHLNPADMGPVSVQIVMDGTQARIDFGADVAATRQILEAGLPELASALRDAGLTLSGGGVSQHSRPRDEAERGAAPRGRSAGIGPLDEAAAPRSAGRRVAIPGGVDLYA